MVVSCSHSLKQIRASTCLLTCPRGESFFITLTHTSNTPISRTLEDLMGDRVDHFLPPVKEGKSLAARCTRDTRFLSHCVFVCRVRYEEIPPPNNIVESQRFNTCLGPLSEENIVFLENTLTEQFKNDPAGSKQT